MDNSELDFFEVVYYSAPAPNSLAALTMLSFVFDRIHFPAVYVPSKGIIDIAETRKERLRLTELVRNKVVNDIGSSHLIGALWAAENIEHLDDFCKFCGGPGFDNTDPEAFAVALDLEELIFGPRKEGVIPIKQGNSVKGLPGEDSIRSQISLPWWSDYCANALIYAARNQTNTSSCGRSQNSCT